MSPLLDIAETDIWYTSPDDVTSDFVYELALYDKYAELYSVSPNGDEPGTFITNFLYCGNEGEDFSFYTLRDDSMELPDIFTDLPEGISEIDLRLSVSNESLTMDYEGNTLSFYNNVIYGLNTSSTAYYLTRDLVSLEIRPDRPFLLFCHGRRQRFSLSLYFRWKRGSHRRQYHLRQDYRRRGRPKHYLYL